MRPILRKLAARWKLLILPVAAVAAGVAVALPASLASTHRAAGSAAPQPDRVKHSVSGYTAHAAAHPGGRRPAPPRAGCRVTYTPTSWPGQFKAKVTISNTGTTKLNDWKLTFTFPGDETISSAWNTTFTQTHAGVSAMSTDYDAVILPGASQSLGFLGTWNSSDAAPASFRINGTTCS